MSNLVDASKEKLLLAEAEHALNLRKALSGSDPGDILSAMKELQGNQNKELPEVKAFTLDALQDVSENGYRSNKRLSNYSLKRMSKVPQIWSVISTRVEQVLRFCYPQKNRYDTGFVIQKKSGYYDDNLSKLTKEEEKQREEITEFMLGCGNPFSSYIFEKNFHSFMSKLVLDSLVYDQCNFENLYRRNKTLYGFKHVDAANIYLADHGEQYNYGNNPYFRNHVGMVGDSGPQSSIYSEDANKRLHKILPKYVQLYSDQPLTYFYPWELSFGVRNPSTETFNYGYGVSELEILMRVVTWMINSDTYNGKFFSQGSAPKGILMVRNANRSRMHEFRQQFKSMVAGVHNAWKIPVLDGDSMNWVDLQKANRDMEFAQWQEYLIKVACGVYKIDPAEINFPLGGEAGKGRGLFEGDNKERIKYSQEKGLFPLLLFLQFEINFQIMKPFFPGWEWKFVGMDVQSEMEQIELDLKKFNGGLITWKELRKKYDLPEKMSDDDWFANQIWLSLQQAKQMGNPESDEALGEFGEMLDDADEMQLDNPFAKAVDSYVFD